MNPIIYGLIVTLFGMLIVFAVLAVLWATLKMMKVVFGEKQKRISNETLDIKLSPVVTEIASTQTAVDEIDAEELVAVITAAINACMTNESKLFIRKITRVGDDAPVWSQIGRHEQMLNRL